MNAPDAFYSISTDTSSEERRIVRRKNTDKDLYDKLPSLTHDTTDDDDLTTTSEEPGIANPPVVIRQDENDDGDDTTTTSDDKVNPIIPPINKKKKKTKKKQPKKPKTMFYVSKRIIRKNRMNKLVIDGRINNVIKDSELLNDPTLRQFQQDPYNKSTWPYDTEFLEAAVDYTKKGELRPQWSKLATGLKEAFEARYMMGKLREKVTDSSTNPLIFDIEFKPNVAITGLTPLLHNKSLIIKVIPLFVGNVRYDKTKAKNPSDLVTYHDNRTLDEIYHDIMIGYFLNELLYGYTNVLTIHFATMIDWFPILGETIASNPILTKSIPMTKRAYCHQAVVMERCEKELEDYLDECETVGTLLSAIRMVTFQVLISLEIAHYTHNFVHGDLSLSNVMMKNVDSLDSLFKGKDLVYKRLGSDEMWYTIPNKSTKGHIAKIIDFGRSSMLVPSDRHHISHADGVDKHVHRNRLKYDLKSSYTVKAYDSVMFLWSMLIYIEGTRKMELKKYSHFMKRVFPDIEGTSDPRQQNSENIDYIKAALNDEFYSVYKKKNKDPSQDMVVSLPTTIEELSLAEKLPSSSGFPFDAKKFTCEMCGTYATHVVEGDESVHYLCGQSCYDSKYL
jgi:serine/threonine protein kinase